MPLFAPLAVRFRPPRPNACRGSDSPRLARTARPPARLVRPPPRELRHPRNWRGRGPGPGRGRGPGRGPSRRRSRCRSRVRERAPTR